MTEMNYKVIQKKMDSKIIQFLLIYINSFDEIYHNLLGSTRIYQELARHMILYMNFLTVKVEIHIHAEGASSD